MLETALHPHLVRQGAVHADDRGVALPRHFGDAAAEYRALRDGAAVVDLGYRTVLVARGPDRTTFLQGMLTNDVAALRAGSGCEALLLTIQGRVTADVRVLALEDVLLLDVDVRARGPFRSALEQLLIADEVEIGELAGGAAVALLGIEGPQAAALLAPLATLPLSGHAAAVVGGVEVRIVRSSEVRGPGAVVHAPLEQAAQVWDALVAAGGRPCGMDALEARRIEVGVPRLGLDMDTTTLALEVPVDARMSQSKGCYLGQEVVARGTARGHVNRRLCGLVCLGVAGPSRRAALLCEGREVGVVTSVAHSFALGTGVALALVRRECWAPGTDLTVADGAPSTVLRVASLPLA